MENYEKKYKEALEKAQRFYNNSVAITKKGLEDIFPELAESKNEMIRKELIRAFQSLNTIDVWNGIKRSDILAWLEAQGEQKPAGTEKGAKGNEKEIPISAWSEEDEKSVNIILDICSDFKKVYSYSRTVLKDANKIESFLKSLKERYTWKPSDLPHWKKSTLPNDNTTGFNSDYFCYKGYCINYKELFEKLPKDD